MGAGGGGFSNNTTSSHGSGANNYQQFHQAEQQLQQQQQQQQQQQLNQSQGFPNNMQQWNQQPQQQGQPQQQQAQVPQQPSVFPTAVPSNFQQGMLNVGMKVMSGQGKDFIPNIEQIDQVFGGGIPGMDYLMRMMRPYFAVDNRYVKRKMTKVLFPFTNMQWNRALNTQQVQGPEMVNYALPHSDENAPDLYLPVMSLVTYCLLSAVLYGTAGEFNPEVIGNVFSKCFFTQVAEVLLIWGCLYAMQTSLPVLDLFSYTGYKYLGLTVCMLCGIFFKRLLAMGTASFYVAFLYTASAAAWFMRSTMANNIPNKTASTGPQRDVVVLAFGGFQFASMWFISQTKYLGVQS